MSEPLKSYLGGISAAEESRRPRHPPAKWKPAAMPPAVLAEALGVRHRRPELWDPAARKTQWTATASWWLLPRGEARG